MTSGRKKIRPGLRAKFILFFLIFGIVLLVSVWIVVYLYTGKVFWERYTESAVSVIDLAAYSLDLTAEEIAGYADTHTADAHYYEVLQEMEEVRRMARLTYLYIIVPKGEDSAIWLFDTDKNGEPLGAPVVNYQDEEMKALRRTLRTGRKSDSLDFTENENDSVVSVFYPIKDARGSTIAVLGADVFLLDLSAVFLNGLAKITVRITALIGFGMSFLLLFVQFGILRTVARLKQGVQKMLEGELGVQVICRRKDELGEITQVFNRMSEKIAKHMQEMEELNSAYQKFVPPETFDILRKESVVDLRLGDQAQEELTILSMEPCGFTEKTRHMPAEEMFQYINGILNRTIPAVLEQKGTVMRLEKAGIRSFYRVQTEYAVKTAIMACEKVREDGERLSVGIATGEVMIGVAGQKERMDIVSISEYGRLSDDLMKMAPGICASILVTENAARRIPDFKEQYHCRFLGYLKIASSGRLTGVYDVFDADEPGERRLKQITKEIFLRGVTLFCAANYREARQAFIEVLRQNREDGAAKSYLDLCSRFMKSDAGEPWFHLFS